jgi:hemolysin activation/secretion protein
MPAAQLATAYQPYIGKNVSQADLAAIATAISDCYRAAGFHLSRAIVPPQDIEGGLVRIEVVEGGITDVVLKGEGAEQFGVRSLLNPVLAEQPSRLTTLERQLMLVNARPGVRITDTALEEIGTASGRFRLIVSLQTWHLYSSFGLDNLGSAAVGPWQSYSMAAFNSYLIPCDTLAVNLSTTPGDVRQLAFGRVSYDVPVGTDGLRIGASGVYSEVWPGDWRRAYNDNTKTETFELRASYSPLQSQRSTLTLTAATSFSNVTEADVISPIYYDKIRTFNLTTDYRLQDNFGGTKLSHRAVAAGARHPRRLAQGRRLPVA